jgi:hypothetical protein
LPGLREGLPSRTAELEARGLARRLDEAVLSTRTRIAEASRLERDHAILTLEGHGLTWELLPSPDAIQGVAPTIQDDAGNHQLWVSAGKQHLATAIPHAWFGEALAHLPYEPGTARFLLDGDHVPMAGSLAPERSEQELVSQLAVEGHGVLESAQSRYGAATVPSTGWTVVVRHPASGVWTPLPSAGNTFLAPPTVLSSHHEKPTVPAGNWSWVGALALLGGLAVVARRHPDRLARLRGRLGEVAKQPRALVQALQSQDMQVPETLPTALGPDELDFLRSEQVRNLREIWTHTEERLSGQRHWVRDEIKRLHEEVHETHRNLAIDLNGLATRVEDERMVALQHHADLKSRADRLEREHRDLEGLGDTTRSWMQAQEERLERVSRIESAHEELSRSLQRALNRMDGQFEQMDSHLEAVNTRIQSLVQRQQEALDRILAMENRSSSRLREIEDRLHGHGIKPAKP